MSGSAKTLDVADVLLLDHGFPCGSHDHLAAEPLVIDRLAAEQAGEHVVGDDLCHRRGTINAGDRTQDGRLPECSTRHSELGGP
jgi:hypothetical protein